MLIRILHSFQNRSINIIMDYCHNGNPISSQVIEFIFKNLISFYSKTVFLTMNILYIFDQQFIYKYVIEFFKKKIIPQIFKYINDYIFSHAD